MSTFYVYVDRTEDGRVFYVGKGTAERCLKFDRNKKHTRIAIAHGIHREIVWRTDDEVAALAYEEQLIVFFETYTSDWREGLGCNFTAGGDGTSGHFHGPEARANIRAACAGKKKGRALSEEHRANLREAALRRYSNRVQ